MKKKALAELAYEQISDGNIVFLDISTINIELAYLLRETPKPVTIVTNMLDIVNILAKSTIDTIFIGGRFDLGRDGFVGSISDMVIDMFQFDLAFMGVVGLDLEKDSVMTYFVEDGITKNKILKHTKQAYMCCLKEKLFQSGNFEYAHVNDFYGIITDADDDSLRKCKIKIIKNNKKQY